ncbi:hypothetical protein SAY86_020846 [Trapa natans]|uniref:Uncharacterized protein n=1 Tax=Trapa natans TaxID=22666 RepID=A0AAN7RCL6_TRANT|nr:hypothetical protein SAY86_020846 [Trapa natans]
MSQGFWMPKVSNNSNDDEMAFNCTSRLETKRSHQWLMDDPRIDLIPIRKQAVGLRNNHSFLESLNSCPSQWGIASGFHTSLGHFGEQSFDLASSGVNNYNGRGIPLIGARKMNVSEKVHKDPLLQDSSFAYTIWPPRRHRSRG